MVTKHVREGDSGQMYAFVTFVRAASAAFVVSCEAAASNH